MENKKLYARITAYLSTIESEQLPALSDEEICLFIDNKADKALRGRMLRYLTTDPELLADVFHAWQLQQPSDTSPDKQKSTSMIKKWLYGFSSLGGMVAASYLAFVLIIPGGPEEIQQQLRSNYQYLAPENQVRGEVTTKTVAESGFVLAMAFQSGVVKAHNQINGIDTTLPDIECLDDSQCESLEYYELLGEWAYMVQAYCESEMASDVQFTTNMKVIQRQLQTELSNSEGIVSLLGEQICPSAAGLFSHFD